MAALARLNRDPARGNPVAIKSSQTDPVAMIRFLLRFIGLVALAAAFILVIYDGTKSIASNGMSITSVRALWQLINEASLAKLEPLLKSYGGGLLWDPVMTGILSAPSWALLGILGIIFILLGRKRRPLIGYAR